MRGFPSTAAADALLSWFASSRRPLPWREEPRDPYRVWLSEVMLQQTRVAAMLPRYREFVARFPTLESLAAAPADEVLARFSGLGYYARARHLHAAAKAAVLRGGLPRSAAGLRALPGFGPYTAAAVASLAFGEQVALVDGNVARVLARLLRIRGSAAEVRARAWEIAPSLLPPGRAGPFNEALMELGATVCKPRAPACGECPLAPHCETRERGDAHDFPPAKPAPARPILVWAAAAVTREDGSVLLRRHPRGELFAGTWGLPWGEAGGAPRKSARDALKACGIRGVALRARGEVQQTLTHRELRVALFSARGSAKEREDLRFVDPANLASVGLSSLARKCLRACGIAVCALLLAGAQAERPTTVIEPRAQALIADLPAPPAFPPPEGPVLSLAEAIARARAASPDLAILRERVVQASLDVGRAWAQIKPRLDLTASYTRNQDPVPLPPAFLPNGNPNSVQGALALQVPLFNGRAFPAIATANQLVDVAQLTEAQQRIELLLQVAATYYSGVQLRELYRVAFRQAKTTRDHAIEAQARFEAGQIQRSAAVRARIDVLRADEEARRAVFAYLSTKSQLAQLLDRRDTAFELEAPPDPPPEVRGAFSDLLDRALHDRPEMAASRANEEIAARLTTDAVLQFFPTLSANAAYRYNNVEDFSGRNLTWAVTVALTLPLYDGGLRYVALKDARSRQREARLRTRSQATRIEDELRRGQLDLESARALREEANHALVYARENEELVRAQFEAGTATQVEVSDAEAALFQSEATALEQRLAVQLAALRVARAVGAFQR